MKMVYGLNIRYPEAYGGPFCSLLDEATEIYAVRTAFKNKIKSGASSLTKP